MPFIAGGYLDYIDEQIERARVANYHPGGWPRRWGRVRQAWAVLRGHFSLHAAWQAGYDQRSREAKLSPDKRDGSTVLAG